MKNTPTTWFDTWYPNNDEEGITFRRFPYGGAEGFDGDAILAVLF